MKTFLQYNNLTLKVSYDQDDKTAGWWNDIHCTNNKSRAYVCAYDNGILKTLLLNHMSMNIFYSFMSCRLVPV